MAIITGSQNPSIHSSLINFVKNHRDRLSEVLGLSSTSVNDNDMADLVSAAIGPQLLTCFEYKGRLDASMVDELSYLPDSMRNISFLSRRLSNRELYKAINKPIHQALEPARQYGHDIEKHMQQWREFRMRKEMRALSSASVTLEKQVRGLMAALKSYEADPSVMGRIRVKARVKTINKTLVSAHRRARMGAIWAIRAGFSGDVVAKAINRLYINRMRGLSKGMAKIDKMTRSIGVDLEITPGMERRASIISRELMAACANPNVLKRKARYNEPSNESNGAVYG